MSRRVSFKGNPLTLVGRLIQEGNSGPNFRAVNSDLEEVWLSDFKEKTKLLTSFPSIDTAVCDMQVKEFNKRALGLASEVVIIGISKDLPFAQRRFCQSCNIQNVTVLSDYKFSSFGIQYGLLIKDLNLLARAVLILDRQNSLRYIQIVDEITHAIDYEDTLKRLSEVLKEPEIHPVKEALPAHCKPCEGGVLPLSKEKVETLLTQYRSWQFIEDKKISKEFKFKDFVEAKYFLDLVSVIANEQGHHPIMTIAYNKLKITLTTHSAGGLTENDFIMARLIDELKAQ